MHSVKTQFKLGHTGGRPKGARNRLAAQVFQDVLTHWNEPASEGSAMTKGREVLEAMYREKPNEYVRAVLSIMPKELQIESVMVDMSDDQLDELLVKIRERCAGAAIRARESWKKAPMSNLIDLTGEVISPEKLLAIHDRLEAEKRRRRAENQLEHYVPYRRQRQFHAAGAKHRERLLIAANQSGKSLAGGMECAMHATGRYPEWWQGKRFDKPTIGWGAGRPMKPHETRCSASLLAGRGNRALVPFQKTQFWSWCLRAARRIYWTASRFAMHLAVFL